MVDGSITTRSYSEDKIRDPALRPLMSKIKVTVDDALEALVPRMAMRILATASDGSQHTVEIVDPKGHPNNPMQDDDIEDKFNAMAQPVIGESRCRDVLAAWWRIRDADSVAALIGLLDLPSRAPKV